MSGNDPARLGSPAFLPADLYGSAAAALAERQRYAPHFWHPVAAVDALPPGHGLALELLDLPVLLTHPPGEQPRAYLNRCPHRGVALLEPAAASRACRRLVCPYHGWTYGLDGQLLAAARESDFLEPFQRQDWPLQPLDCAVMGPLIWVAIGSDPLPLEQQLDLVLAEAGERFGTPRQLLAQTTLELACNWKIAHDNTLDDYHVAIAHPQTLHRYQGPVRDYRHALSPHGSLLATPMADGEFLTFGLAPWTHLLLWPDGRLAVISFPPLSLERCRMDLWLLGEPSQAPMAPAWLESMLTFLEEDRRLVESAQRGYASGLRPGPPHRLERRLLQQQQLYDTLMGLRQQDPAHRHGSSTPSPH
ncbi:MULTISPECIES: aromatic ring-hydroxylating oxygenase subunit alpha [Aphanothece]|uniref:aromatic ring-hydroxylating oxygenase subunit alpha n=1 Tax=Aphanothece TaxID=1121 RepID=UPI00398467B4